MEAVPGCIRWGGGGAVWQNVGERRYTEKQKPRMVDGRCGESSGEEEGSMEDERRHERQRRATANRPKAPVWPEEEGSQEGGRQSTNEYGGITVPKA